MPVKDGIVRDVLLGVHLGLEVGRQEGLQVVQDRVAVLHPPARVFRRVVRRRTDLGRRLHGRLHARVLVRLHWGFSQSEQEREREEVCVQSPRGVAGWSLYSFFFRMRPASPLH